MMRWVLRRLRRFFEGSAVVVTPTEREVMR